MLRKVSGTRQAPCVVYHEVHEISWDIPRRFSGTSSIEIVGIFALSSWVPIALLRVNFSTCLCFWIFHLFFGHTPHTVEQASPYIEFLLFDKHDYVFFSLACLTPSPKYSTPSPKYFFCRRLQGVRAKSLRACGSWGE